MLKRFALAALSMALLTGTALAQYTITNAGPIDSAGDIGDSGNGTFTSTYAGATSLYGSFSFSGDLTSVIPATWIEEASFHIQQTTALGGLPEVFLTPGSGEDWTGTLPISFSTPGLFWFSSGAQYSFEAFEEFSDGPGADATWTNLEFVFSDTVTTTSIGSFVAGTPFVFDTVGSPGGIDTELAVYTADGTLLDFNDDMSDDSLLSLVDLGNLPVGDYTLVVGTFNSAFGDGFAIPGGGSGNYVVNLNGSTVSSGNIDANQFRVFNFAVNSSVAAPEPGTLALFGLAALPLAGVLRRRK